MQTHKFCCCFHQKFEDYFQNLQFLLVPSLFEIHHLHMGTGGIVVYHLHMETVSPNSQILPPGQIHDSQHIVSCMPILLMSGLFDHSQCLFYQYYY